VGAAEGADIMCIVSNITNPWNAPSLPPQYQLPKDWLPQNWPIPPIEEMAPGIAKQLLDVIERLDKIDKALGLLTCKVEKAEKQKIVRKLKRQARK